VSGSSTPCIQAQTIASHTASQQPTTNNRYHTASIGGANVASTRTCNAIMYPMSMACLFVLATAASSGVCRSSSHSKSCSAICQLAISAGRSIRQDHSGSADLRWMALPRRSRGQTRATRGVNDPPASISVTPPPPHPNPVCRVLGGVAVWPWCITPPRPVREAREDGGGEATEGVNGSGCDHPDTGSAGSGQPLFFV
jgi:hypothetical protein